MLSACSLLRLVRFLLKEDKMCGKREKKFKLELISDATIKY